VSKEFDQEMAKRDLETQVNNARLGQANVDELRVRKEQRRREVSQSEEQRDVGMPLTSDVTDPTDPLPLQAAQYSSNTITTKMERLRRWM
jgi:hypothetical protein